MKCDFCSVVIHKCLRVCSNGCFVFILLFVQTVHAASENLTLPVKQFSTHQPHSDADPQIPKSQGKCCFGDEWLFYCLSDERPHCVGLPPKIKHMPLNSSWSVIFAEFGSIIKSQCLKSSEVEIWTKSNARNYQQFFENKTVLNFKTNTYFTVLCSDYINLIDHYSGSKNYDNEDFKELENEIIQPYLRVCSDSEEINYVHIEIMILLFYCKAGVTNFFLIVTFYLYISTPKLRRKVYDKCFLCLLASFILGFSFSVCQVRLQIEPSIMEEHPTFCIFTAFMFQYWFLSALSWLTVSCVELSYAIDSQKYKHSNSKKFIIYCLCAWGFPLLMSFATFLATHIDSESYFKVDFHEGSCWFQENIGNPYLKQPEFIYYFSYISLTLLIDVCFFIYTFCKIISNDYHWWKKKDSQKHGANDGRFLVYLKLFFVMGFTLMFQIIAYMMEDIFGSRNWIFFVLDSLLSVLHSVLIFVVFVCNARVLTLLKERFFSTG